MLSRCYQNCTVQIKARASWALRTAHGWAGVLGFLRPRPRPAPRPPRPPALASLGSAPAGCAGLPLAAVSMVTRGPALRPAFQHVSPGAARNLTGDHVRGSAGVRQRAGGGGERSRRGGQRSPGGEEPRAPPASRRRPHPHASLLYFERNNKTELLGKVRWERFPASPTCFLFSRKTRVCGHLFPPESPQCPSLCPGLITPP